jgi:hypothetical protein
VRELQRLRDDPHRLLYLLALANTVIWVIAIVAMVILTQDAPAVKKLFPILASGVAVGNAVIATISRTKR